MMQPNQDSSRSLRLLTILTGIFAFLGLLYLIARRLRLHPLAPAAKIKPFKPPVDGLSEEQAARLQTGQRALARQQLEQQAKRTNWRTSAISVFNLTMLVMAISQFWLDDPLGALATLGVLLLNTTVNAFQQNFAARRVGEVALQAQPFATVVREGRLRSIPLDDIVIGDVLVVGPGDEIMTNGIILESQNLSILDSLSNEDSPLNLRKGDPVRAGGVCESGQGVYRVSEPPPVYPTASVARRKSASAGGKTHLESILMRLLYFLLALAGFFYAILLMEIFRIGVMTPEQMSIARDVMGIIFGLAPTGFFLMIVVNYAMGTFDLARLGAIVRDKRAIETLADLTSLCIHQKTLLSNLDVQTEMISFKSDAPVLADNFVHRALGDIGRSISSRHIVLTAITDTFDGQHRQADQQVFFFSLNGWGAANFTYPDLRGTFVIGYPDVLKSRLAKSLHPDRPPSDDATGQPKTSLFGRLRSRFARPKDEPGSIQNPDPASQDPPDLQPDTPDGLEPAISPEKPQSKGLFSRARASVQGVFKKIGESARNRNSPPAETSSVLDLLFAYLPEPVDLYGPDGIPRCPDQLIPICKLHFKKKAQAEMASVFRSIREEGIQVKIFVHENNGLSEAAAMEVGLFDENDPNAVASASELAVMDQAQLAEAVSQASMFKNLNRYQMGRVIKLLRDSGKAVGVLGSSVLDIQPMRNASLTIVPQVSDQALLTQADIVLLKGHPEPLRKALTRGQQIVHGTLDVIKLNMVQIGYVLLLLVAMLLLDRSRFFYSGAQGGMVALFTITLPAVFLSIWAPTGAVNRGSMRIYLVRFILPPAITIALAVLLLDRRLSSTTTDVIYAQHVITHALVSMGLLLVVFARPAARWLAGGDRLTRDIRPTIVAAALFVLWNGFVWIGLVQKYLFVAPLASLRDYLTVWLTALIWGIAVQLVWRLPFLNRSVDYLSAWLEIKEEPGLVEAQAPV